MTSEGEVASASRWMGGGGRGALTTTTQGLGLKGVTVWLRKIVRRLEL